MRITSIIYIYDHEKLTYEELESLFCRINRNPQDGLLHFFLKKLTNTFKNVICSFAHLHVLLIKTKTHLHVYIVSMYILLDCFSFAFAFALSYI